MDTNENDIVLSHWYPFPCTIFNKIVDSDVLSLAEDTFGDYKFGRSTTQCLGRNVYMGT